jgi:hypothetical protein
MVGGSAVVAWRSRDLILTWTCRMVVPFAGSFARCHFNYVRRRSPVTLSRRKFNSLRRIARPTRGSRRVTSLNLSRPWGGNLMRWPGAVFQRSAMRDCPAVAPGGRGSTGPDVLLPGRWGCSGWSAGREGLQLGDRGGNLPRPMGIALRAVAGGRCGPDGRRWRTGAGGAGPAGPPAAGQPRRAGSGHLPVGPGRHNQRRPTLGCSFLENGPGQATFSGR